MEIKNMPFDTGKLKKFFGTMLMVAVVITAIYGAISFVLYVLETQNPINFLSSPSFVTVLIGLILEYVGYLMLNGKFQVSAEVQQMTGRYQQTRQSQQPQQQQQIPTQLQFEKCSFCGRDVPAFEIKKIKTPDGTIYNVCANCLKE